MQEGEEILSEELQTLKNVESKLKELLKWTKFAGMQQLRNILLQAIGDDAIAALVFELSDGTRGTREVGKLAGIGNATVARYWRKWSKIGIVELSNAYQGRYQRICSLGEVGLPVPESLESSHRNQAIPNAEDEHNE
jgi:hypothetical protein